MKPGCFILTGQKEKYSQVSPQKANSGLDDPSEEKGKCHGCLSDEKPNTALLVMLVGVTVTRGKGSSARFILSSIFCRHTQIIVNIYHDVPIIINNRRNQWIMG